MTEKPLPSFVGIRTLARVTGLSLTWLDSEARGGRLPMLTAGRRRLFNVEAVESALLDRARQTPKPGPGGGGHQ